VVSEVRFVLIHGGTSGAFCWAKLVPELAALGHEGVAVDLPGHGARQSERSTVEGYRDAVLEVLRDGDVLVGNSLGGCVVTVAADAAPQKLRHLIILAGAVAVDGASFRDSGKIDHSAYVEEVETAHGPAIAYTREGARHLFYNDCSEDDVDWLFPQHGPQQLAPLTTPISLRRFPDIGSPRSLILCTLDNSGVNDGTESYLERIGTERAYVMDASHSPFVSRPRDTAALLARIAA
jgi:pimeloyl-ACP methyl ester carboxylesterase